MTNSPEAETVSDLDAFLGNGGFAFLAVVAAVGLGLLFASRAPGDVSPEAYTVLPEPKKTGWRNMLGSDA